MLNLYTSNFENLYCKLLGSIWIKIFYIVFFIFLFIHWVLISNVTFQCFCKWFTVTEQITLFGNIFFLYYILLLLFQKMLVIKMPLCHYTKSIYPILTRSRNKFRIKYLKKQNEMNNCNRILEKKLFFFNK